MRVLSVNLGRLEPNPHKGVGLTGIHKHPFDAIQVRDPGPKHGGLGSGVSDDAIGDTVHHGGSRQAVYAFAREDYDRWESELGRVLTPGLFGENLTTEGIDLNACLIGERWQVGDAELQVTDPRIPCATFAGVMDEPQWVKRFTAAGRSGNYLAVTTPGTIRPGDSIEVVFRPDHGVTMATFFAALTVRRDLEQALVPAFDYLGSETRERLIQAGFSS